VCLRVKVILGVVKYHVEAVVRHMFDTCRLHCNTCQAARAIVRTTLQVMTRQKKMWWFIVLLHFVALASCQKLNPGEKAPNFTLPTLEGPKLFKGVGNKGTNIHPPIIFHEFTNHSGFLECLWTKDSSLMELIDNSPENTDYVFLSSSTDAVSTAIWMKQRFEDVLEKYYALALNLSLKLQSPRMRLPYGWENARRSSVKGSNIHPDYSNRYAEQGQRRSFNDILHHQEHPRLYPIPHRRIYRRSLNEDDGEFDIPNLNKQKYHNNSYSHIVESSKKFKLLHNPRLNTISPNPFRWRRFDEHENLKFIDSTHATFHKGNRNEKIHFDKRNDRKRSLIARLRSETNDEGDEVTEFDSSALEDRVRRILQKGKYRFISDWLEKLHFVTVPIYQVGNWLPLIMSRWYCSGHGCGFDQISVEGKEEGDVMFVMKRLDARYDWLPSPYKLKPKHSKVKVKFFSDGCKKKAESTTFSGKIALVSREGNCSFFEKIMHAQLAGALGAIVFSTPTEPLVDMTCEGADCEEEMKIPGTMISYENGMKILKYLAHGDDIYVNFQHTPSRNFFVAIDEQGKLQEVGWLLFPSMIFLSYQAKWLNYMTNLVNNVTAMDSTSITVFNATIMQGKKGIVRTIKLPEFSELQKYRHVYLDMSLGCPGITDFSCPHWDHTVQLFVCCNKTSDLCGKEVARWITPFRRRIGRWLSNIRPVIPLFNSDRCTFVMKTVPWAMPWKPSLSIRLAGKSDGNVAPNTILPLFRGGKFDQSYNIRGKRKLTFNIPSGTKKVQIFATITGHGSDNNNCAEFCVTSHHFIVNGKHENSRIFDTAGTSTGCADQVSQGSEPNEHGTWLYGRNGWCDGQNIAPWVEDITAQLDFDKENKIRYFGYFNGTDPDPRQNPGNIIMYSYLVFSSVVPS